MNKQKNIKELSVLLGLLLASGLFFLSFQQKAWAYTVDNYQENVEDRFVISPVNLELNISAGETTTQKMMVVNRLGRTANFSVTTEDFEGSTDPEKATVFLGDQSSDVTSAKDWIKPEATEISLNHGDRLSLPLTITVPPDASAGSHYAAVFISVSSQNQKGDKSNVQLVSRAGLLILINVPGENKELGALTEFKTDKLFYRNGPVDFSTVFQNSGNVYAKVGGEISIKNMLGAEVGHITVPEWVVLSNSSRRQTAKWDKHWLCGRYTANITAFYGFGGNLKLERTVVFYAFPWHVALILLLIFMCIYYFFKYLTSKFEIRKKGATANESTNENTDFKHKV